MLRSENDFPLRLMAHTRGTRSVGALLLGMATLALPLGCATRSPVPQEDGASAASGQRLTQKPLVLRIEPSERESGRLATAGEAAAREDYDLALRIFRELLQENPTLADAYTGMGSVLEQQGEIERAEPAYARAAALNPEDFAAQSGHGRVLEALGRTREAMRAVQRALAIRPRDLDANVAMSRLLLATQQADAAVNFAERAVEADPQSGRAHLILARAYSVAGRSADSIRSYETACELIEPPVEVMFALINAYAEAKRYREAANAAEALTKTAPSAAAYERLGWSLFRLNEFKPSDDAYRKSIELDPEYWPALNGVGVNALNAWIRGGRRPDDPLRAAARAMLQRSLRSNGDQPKVGALLLKYNL